MSLTHCDYFSIMGFKNLLNIFFLSFFSDFQFSSGQNRHKIQEMVKSVAKLGSGKMEISLVNVIQNSLTGGSYQAQELHGKR